MDDRGVANSPHTPLDVLRAVRTLLTDENHWTKRQYARDTDGLPVRATEPEAARWCVLGATGKVCGIHPGDDEAEQDGSLYRQTFDVLNRIEPWPAVKNDEGDHADMLALLDRAIASLETPTES